MFSGSPLNSEITRCARHFAFVPTADSCTSARRSCFRLRFRGDGRRQRARSKRRMSGRTVANLPNYRLFEAGGSIDGTRCRSKVRPNHKMSATTIARISSYITRLSIPRSPNRRISRSCEEAPGEPKDIPRAICAGPSSIPRETRPARREAAHPGSIQPVGPGERRACDRPQSRSQSSAWSTQLCPRPN
jgi:hypothetical protein